MKHFSAAAAAMAAMCAAASAEPDAPQADIPFVFAQKLQNVTRETAASLNTLVLASAETRLKAKIDNLPFEKPYQETLPAFAMLSAFTID